MASQSIKKTPIRSIGVLAVAALSTFGLVPGGAEAKSNVGGGAVHGIVRFASPGIPPIGAGCIPGTLEVEGNAPGFVLNTVITGYVGEILISGPGTVVCGEGAASSGTLDLTLSGAGPTGSELLCDVSGVYTRFGTVLQAPLTGGCVVNQYGTGQVTFAILLNVTPLPNDPPTGVPGVTESISQAAFDGVFTIIPSTEE